MLRTTIDKNISPKEQLVLQTNHNFFIRTVFANIAKIVIASIILAAVVIVAYIIDITDNTNSNSATPIFTVLAIAYIVYAIYFIATVSEIVTLYKKSTAIENEILGGKTGQSQVDKRAAERVEDPSRSEQVDDDL